MARASRKEGVLEMYKRLIQIWPSDLFPAKVKSSALSYGVSLCLTVCTPTFPSTLASQHESAAKLVHDVVRLP